MQWQHVDARDVDWDRANCISTDPDEWFAEKRGSYRNTPQERICQRCDIREQCANWAIEHESHGYWAGLTAEDRWRIRRALKITLHSPEVGVLGRVHSSA